MQRLRHLLNLSMQHNEVLTNVRAPKVARARRLLKRGFRESDGAFLAEGPQACREGALAGKVTELFSYPRSVRALPRDCGNRGKFGGRDHALHCHRD